MKRARKSNRVSWATGGNLCQVKLFLSDDFPSKVGQHSQDHLQIKTSMLNSNSAIIDPTDLPPGFESSHFLKQTRVDLSCISQIKWECPLPFIVNPDWRVVAGEESREKENQKARENRVLEAVYPRLSAIPPSPSVSLEVEEEDYDDDVTPLIPIIPIEEEEPMDILPEVAVAGNPFPNVQPNNPLQHISAETSIRSPSNAFYTDSSDPCSGIPLGGGVSFGMEADLAASVVATIMRSSEQGSPIDMDLLVKIFNDPKMLDKLINEHRTAATTTSASTSTVDTTPGVKPDTPVLLSTSDVKASGATPTSAVGSLPFGLKTTYPSVPVLSPTPDKPSTLSVPAVPSVSLFSPAHDNPVTASVPLSRPLSGKPGTPSVSLLTNTPASHIPRSVSKQIHHVSSGISPALNTQPHQDTALASGPKRVAAMGGELSTGPVPSLTRNLHAVVNPVQSPASTLPYKLSTGSSAFAVKDANYYKNLIRQHGADKQDMQDSHIGIRHSNLQDMKPVHNFKQGEVKHKIQKPCIYFKSSKGCRNGSNCPYQHDVSAQWGAGNILGAQSAKRLKSGP
ncbi:Zinc finger CCCH domain-containing protein [Vigna angularis]|uniref:Zinc finger CCCH domain-containing protein n=1 Tax=Phaseolus angularis TaxID=3914 RepID=A0A8T0L9Y4_PHAAN|nr:zinc finger CCCH domain-containing protein 6 isoform X1 [Vigna angularis]KAG2408784.1 Zinc finger CCCH domain-containing protein [Vigna angularis]